MLKTTTQESYLSRVRALLFLFGAALLSACSNDFADMPDTDLADGIYTCRTEIDQSPGMAIRCDNYQRECERRRDEGRFVC